MKARKNCKRTNKIL